MPSNTSKTDGNKAGFTVPQVQPSRRRDAEASSPAESPSSGSAEESNGLVPTASSHLSGRPVQPQQEVPVTPLDTTGLEPPPGQPLMIPGRTEVIALRVDAADAAWYKRYTRMAAAHYDIPDGVIPRIVMAMLKENMPEVVRQAVLVAKGVDIGPQ